MATIIQGRNANAKISGFIINLPPNNGGKKFKTEKTKNIFSQGTFLDLNK